MVSHGGRQASGLVSEKGLAPPAPWTLLTTAFLGHR